MSRRHEILRRATEVFEKKGVAQTSIGDIAEAVGIKREAIYYYFSNRREILLEIILPLSRELARNMDNILESSQSAREKLHAAIECHLHRYDPGYLEMTVALREDHFFKEDKRLDELRMVWRSYTDGWETLIRQGQENGEFAPDVTPKVVAYGILGMCNWLARWFDPAGEVSIDEIIRTYSLVATVGLARPEGAVEAGLARFDQATVNG